MSFRLERTRERRDRVAVGLLDERPLPPLDLEQLPEILRVEEDLLLGRPLREQAEGPLLP